MVLVLSLGPGVWFGVSGFGPFFGAWRLVWGLGFWMVWVLSLGPGVWFGV